MPEERKPESCTFLVFRSKDKFNRSMGLDKRCFYCQIQVKKCRNKYWVHSSEKMEASIRSVECF